MHRKIRISSSYTGVLPVASYANVRPAFSAEEEFDINETSDEVVETIIRERQQHLQAICFQNFEFESEKARIQKVKNDLKNFRFIFDPKLGIEVPSVTSIQNYDKDMYCSDEDLKIYASQGNLIDAEFRNLAKTGEYKPNADLLECTADRFILKTRKTSGGKYLALDGWSIQEFVEKYKITEMKSFEEPIFNRQHRYGGTPDIGCKMDGVKTLLSVKRTYQDVENFVQDSAYAKCDGMDYAQIAVGEFKPEADGGNKQGFSKPRITTDIDKYFEIFLRRRSEVIKIFGV